MILLAERGKFGDCCIELTDTERDCGRPGIGVRLPCPAGRPDARGGPYCDEHGGEARARAEAERDWNYAAPESVGSAERVAEAGALSLNTQHAYVVLRQNSPGEGGVWLAWLGLGSHMAPVRNPEGGAGERQTKRGKGGGKSFATRDAAEAAARSLWRYRVTREVEEIRAARGGTLEWGTPVEPLDEPIVIVLEQGEQRSAWDVAVTLPRVSRPGLAVFSGLRPSGEAA